MIAPLQAPRRRAQRTASAAAVFTAPRQVAIQDRELPEAGQGQVRIRIDGTGVSRSSLLAWQGRPDFAYPLLPGAPGHEGWGRVDAIGSGVHGIALGDRVVSLSHAAFAEHDIAEVSDVVPLPSSLGDTPFPGEALGNAMNILRRSNISDGQTIAIVGIGFVGAALTMLASNMGARVIAISCRPFSLDIAEACGASFILRDEGTVDVLKQAQAIVGRAGCDRVIETMGTQESLDTAIGLAGIRSRVVIAGYHQGGDRRVDLQSWNDRSLDIVNAHQNDPRELLRGVRDAVNAVAQGALDPSVLLTHEFPLDEIDQAFRMMEERPNGFVKAWVHSE